MPGWITETGREPVFDGESVIADIQSVTGSSDTSAVDALRQGIECTRTAHFFNSMQPKLFVNDSFRDGTISHRLPQSTFGIAPSFIEFNHSTRVNDSDKFDAVAFLESEGTYPTPILSNYGPKQNEEATLEPLTIANRKMPDNEGRYKAHAVYGAVEAGSSFDRGIVGVKILEQAVRVGQQNSWETLVEDGEYQFGTEGGSVTIPGFYKSGKTLIDPVIDWSTAERYAASTLDSAEPLLEAFLKLAGVAQAGGTSQEAKQFTKKLVVAGTDVYGPRATELGSDSIAYAGWIRGS